jgi:predicted dehydrogenase
MLGYGFMGKEHANAFHTLRYVDWPGVAYPELIAIAGRTEPAVREAATRYGFAGYYTDWHGLVEDERIQLFDNVADDPAHVEPTIAAAQAGKHVVCEKPLAVATSDAKRMWQAAEQAAVKHLCCYNYRFVPAVRLARDMLKRGELGDVCQARFRYSQEWRRDPSSELPSPAGVLRIIGCHAIDQARFLVGEIANVSSLFSGPVTTPERRYGNQPVEPDDVWASLVQFENGVVATVDASLVSRGRRNLLAWEINCAEGTLVWNLEQLNELRVFGWRESQNTVDGLMDVIVCEPDHPFMDLWWPTGHILGWEHSHINMLSHFLRCVVGDRPVGPDAATFEDGYRTALISECMHKAAETRQRVEIPRE